ncbi:MAG TPA: flagellar export protein FliJ [Caulobacteraceae bacterium]|jgi:flagellar FliJ protein|nr:flagellar export protein FliJ [Caulobacteraceae bacterium]
MKWTGSLIRIAEHEIEGLRRRIAEISARRIACEAALVRLAQEAITETTYSHGDADAGWYLIGFREGWKVRKARALAELAAVEQEEQGARDALNRAFEELKKVEHVAETARLAEAKETARRETVALDEMAAQRRGRK